MYSTLGNVLCSFEENMHFAIVGWNLISINQDRLVNKVLQVFYMLIFQVLLLAVIEIEVWKFPSIIINLSISSGCSVRFCFLHHEVLFLIHKHLWFWWTPDEQTASQGERTFSFFMVLIAVKSTLSHICLAFLAFSLVSQVSSSAHFLCGNVDVLSFFQLP